MRYLFIAEKPSLMRDVRSCYQNHMSEIKKSVGTIDFVALAGHACRNGEPNDYEEWNNKWENISYPMIPSHWIIKPIQDKRSILKNIKEKASSYDGIIVGTDSDTEGYGIYYLIEQHLGLQHMKALRFMEHSLTDKEILKSLLTMTDYHTDPVHVRYTQSFLLRSRADWLYGMNATRLATSKTGKLLTIGRVKAPTLKLVYDNSMAIENFKPETYYQLQADYGTFKAIMIEQDGKPSKFKTPNPNLRIPLEGIVYDKKEVVTKTHAPKLYDLSSLQMDAGQMFGYTPKQTLELVQSLYERHKVISYPRTQCRYVSSEKAKEFPSMLEKMAVFQEFAPYLKLVGDIRHHLFKTLKDTRGFVGFFQVQNTSILLLLLMTLMLLLLLIQDIQKKQYLHATLLFAVGTMLAVSQNGVLITAFVFVFFECILTQIFPVSQYLDASS